MSLLDEKITALFRRGSPIFNGAELAPSVDRPIVEKAASETVVSESAIEEAIATRVDEQPRSASQGDYGRANKLTMDGIGFRYGDTPPLGTARYQSQANEINARQSKRFEDLDGNGPGRNARRRAYAEQGRLSGT